MLSSSELSLKAQHCLWPWVSWVETWIIHYSETRSWRAGSVTLGHFGPRPCSSYTHTIHTTGPERCPTVAQETPSWQRGAPETAISIPSLSLTRFLPTHFPQYLGQKKAPQGNCVQMPWQPRHLWGHLLCALKKTQIPPEKPRSPQRERPVY